MTPQRIVLDFDSVLLDCRGAPFTTASEINGRPVGGAVDWCWARFEEGHTLLVSSARIQVPGEPTDDGWPIDHGGKIAIELWLSEWGFPTMRVCLGKPFGHVYIDDKAHRFHGDWAAAHMHPHALPWQTWDTAHMTPRPFPRSIPRKPPPPAVSETLPDCVYDLQAIQEVVVWWTAQFPTDRGVQELCADIQRILRTGLLGQMGETPTPLLPPR